ncbi:hypothetical protein, partial [Mycobacterium pseudoshottsii]|uniref:hypothetical protein n=1 Tax=Mycobacterium pseudoshottsii TaxID=265949 RepID=UPI003F75E332
DRQPPPRPPQSTIPQLTSLLINNAGALGVIRSHARASRETTLLCACLNKAAASAFFESKL